MTSSGSAWQRAIPRLLAVSVLGLGVWSGLALVAPSTPSTDETLDVAVPSDVVSTTAPVPQPAPATTPPTTAAPSPASTPAAVDNSVAGLEAQVVTLVNQERAAAGCAALTTDSRLTAAARAHSADMARRDYFDHTTPEGVDFATRITDAGYRWSAAAENIAAGQRSPADVMASWMNSDGHRRNILNCSLRQIGVGLAYNSANRPYWTQDFASPR